MAITITKCASQVGDTAASAVYSMRGVFLPAASAKVFVAYNVTASVVGSVSGDGGLAWTLLGSCNPQAGGHAFRMFDVFTGVAPTSLAINVNVSGDNGTGAVAAAVQLTGVLSGAAPVQTKVVNSIGANPAVAWNQATVAGNGVMAMIAFNGALAAPITPPAGWTLITASYGSPTTGFMLAYRTDFAGTSAVFSTGAVTGMSYMTIEYALGNNPTALAVQAITAPAIVPASHIGLILQALGAAAVQATTLIKQRAKSLITTAQLAASSGPTTVFKALATAAQLMANAAYEKLVLVIITRLPFLLPILRGRWGTTPAPVGAQSLFQGVNAKAIQAGALGKAPGKVLRATMVGSSAVSRSLFRALLLGAAALATAGLTRIISFGRTLSAQTITTASLSRLTSFYRALSAQAIATVAAGRTLLVARTLQVSTVAVTAISRAGTLLRTLSVQAIAMVGRTLAVAKTVPASSLTTAALGRIASLFAPMTATIASVATVVRTTSAAQLYLQSLAAAASLAAAIVRATSGAQAYTQALAASMLEAASVLKATSKGLAAKAAAAVTLARELSLSKLLQVAALSTVTFQRALGKVLGVAASATAQVSQLAMRFKTLASQAVSTVIIARVSNVAQLYTQALAATAALVAAISRAGTIVQVLAKALSATAAAAAAIGRTSSIAQTFTRALAVTTAAAAALQRTFFKSLTVILAEQVRLYKGLYKALTAVTIGAGRTIRATAKTLNVAVLITPALTKLMQLYRLLTASYVVRTFIIAPVLTTGTSAALAWERVTSFVRGRSGLRRQSSTTEARNSGVTRPTRSVTDKKRGDDDEDIT